MADIFTPELNLVKPEVGQSVDTWGTKLNSNMDKLDVAHVQQAAALAALRSILVGMVVGFPVTAAPEGWLKCNGAAVSRTTYSTLFARIGITHGDGDGETTFNLPDYRGVFLRWLDDGAGIDAGRAITQLQDDDFKAHDHDGSTSSDSHSHYGTTNTSGYHDHSASASTNGNHSHSGSTNAAGNHRHSVTNAGGELYPYQYDRLTIMVGNTLDNSTAYTDYAGNHAHSLSINGNGNHTHTIYLSPNGNHTHSFSTNTDTHNHSISIGNRGGSETRPVNRALLACILY